ncbi:helix-turn-helix domain-containing protein [Vibrio harveyi]|uniref:helix-turn-helix domain-containing protein n=1 Tax=Vibrio harveyi TaxID=669 RepID=UPI003CF39DC9
MKCIFNPFPQIRRFMGITQTQAAKRCGLHPSTYAKREIGYDSRLNTVIATLNGLGLKARLVVEIDNGDELKFKLTEK